MDLTTRIQTVICFPEKKWVSPRNLDLYSKKNILYCQSYVRRSNKDRWSQLRKNLFQEAMNPMYFLESSGYKVVPPFDNQVGYIGDMS
jgi:hypothetical protein